MSKMKDKIEEIQHYLFELDSFMPSSFEEYRQNIEKKAACERYFEKIIEAVIDVAFLLIKEKKLRIPEEDKETFDVLVEEGIIATRLAVRLKDAKGMRNILSHQYSNIDDEVVFEAITEELERDVKEFIESLERTR